ncbi:MAG: hypothetical protein ABIN58_01715 [candidate division WOR-3 bacterium]
MKNGMPRRLITIVALAVILLVGVGLVGAAHQLMLVRVVTSFFTGLVPLSYAIITSKFISNSNNSKRF